MRPRKLVRTAVAVTVAISLGGALAAGPTPAVPRDRPAPAPSVAGMKVLLTNDDSVQGQSSRGTDGKGLYEIRRALCTAGADVAVVGPWGQQSGSSARVTTPGSAPVPLTVQPVTPPAAYGDDCAGAPSGGAVYGVCQAAAPCVATSPSASPADTVMVALSRFVPDNIWPEGPDLVVSGINFGQNAGEAVNHSGTVGAAITALEFHQPSIAFSAEFDFSCRPDPFACVPFTQTAAFARDLIAQLRAHDLLDPATALNVNYPVVGPGETLGRPEYAVVGTSTNIPFAYTGAVGDGGGTYGLTIGTPVPETRRDADTTVLAREGIPITPLDGDWTASGRSNRLRGFIRSDLRSPS